MQSRTRSHVPQVPGHPTELDGSKQFENVFSEW